jgi:short-subunit dehydrogenase
MGLSVAKKLSAKGANIILVARSVGKLEAALAIVKVNPPHRARLLSLQHG